MGYLHTFLNGGDIFEVTHHRKRSNELGKEFVIDYANRQIQQGKKTGFWQRAIKWYGENEITEETLPVYVLLEQKAHGYVYDRNTNI